MSGFGSLVENFRICLVEISLVWHQCECTFEPNHVSFTLTTEVPKNKLTREILEIKLTGLKKLIRK